MWSPWKKVRPPHGQAAQASSPSPQPPRYKVTSSPSPLNRSSSSSSIKDLCSLLGDDSDFFSDSEDPSWTSPCPSPSPSRSPHLCPSPVHRVRSASSALRQWRAPQEDPFGLPPGEEKRVVLYFTSLRVVRPAFNRSSEVRTIFRALRVAVDERDVSMDAGFLRELSTILAARRRPLNLPQVFIGGRHFGGADEVRRLYETGDLVRYVEGVAPAAEACESCHDVRFVICRICSGSRRCYSEKGGGGFRTCKACNEYGIVRCPRCCCAGAV